MLPCLPDSVFFRLNSASFYSEIDKKNLTGSSRVGCVLEWCMQTSPQLMHTIGIRSLFRPVVLENLYKQVTKTYHKDY